MTTTNGPIGPQRKHEPHRGQNSVQVGGLTIFPGGDLHLTEKDLGSFERVFCLTEKVKPTIATAGQRLVHYPVPDFHAPPANWREFLENSVIGTLRESRAPKVLLLCAGSHGRTGTLIAGLIAILEPDTIDPIAAVRERHCEKAVETLRQAEAVFALRGAPVPEYWVAEFTSI